MKYLPALAAVCLLIVPSVALAQQISPNPNPAGNTITVDTFDFFNSVGFANDGTISISERGQLTNNATGRITNKGKLEIYGQLLNADKGELVNQSDAMTIQAGGHLENAHDGTLGIGGTLTIHGSLTNFGNLNNYFNSKLINHGSYFHNYGTLNNNISAEMTNSGTMTNNGTYNVRGRSNNSGTLTNNNVLFVWTDGSLINTGTFVNQITLNHLGTIDTTKGTFTNYGTLNGNGTIKGSYTDRGVTKPGNSAGVMTIEGDYFKVDGSKEIELGGLFDGGGDNAVAEFDRIDVTGNVELAGALHVKLIDGFKLHRGNWFDIMRVGGTLSGQYDGLGEGALVGNFDGQDLFITYGGMGDGGGVALFTNVVPEPTTVLIWSMLAGLGMTVRRRR